MFAGEEHVIGGKINDQSYLGLLMTEQERLRVMDVDGLNNTYLKCMYY